LGIKHLGSQYLMEIAMSNRFLIAAATSLMIGGFGATAAELPTYEVNGLSITSHQLAVVGPANAEEEAPTPGLTLAGMPASPHQIAVLTPRRRLGGTVAANIVKAGPLQSQ
jgi:hypothetical protein